MRNGNSGKIISIILSCEQCPAVYLENLAYDTAYAQYSPGKMIYHYYLGQLAEKGKKELFLSGGKFEYKRHYEAEEDYTGRYMDETETYS